MERLMLVVVGAAVAGAEQEGGTYNPKSAWLMVDSRRRVLPDIDGELEEDSVMYLMMSPSGGALPERGEPHPLRYTELSHGRVSGGQEGEGIEGRQCKLSLVQEAFSGHPLYSSETGPLQQLYLVKHFPQFWSRLLAPELYKLYKNRTKLYKNILLLQI